MRTRQLRRLFPDEWWQEYGEELEGHEGQGALSVQEILELLAGAYHVRRYWQGTPFAMALAGGPGGSMSTWGFAMQRLWVAKIALKMVIILVLLQQYLIPMLMYEVWPYGSATDSVSIAERTRIETFTGAFLGREVENPQ